MDIEIRRLAPQPMLGIHATVSLAEVGPTLAEILPTVWSYLESRGTQPAAPPLATYREVGAERWEMVGGFALAAPVAGEGRIVAGDLPGGDVAVAWHVGPYERLHETYKAIVDRLRADGRTPGPLSWEIYWTDPGEEPDSAKWRTEVFVTVV